MPSDRMCVTGLRVTRSRVALFWPVSWLRARGTVGGVMVQRAGRVGVQQASVWGSGEGSELSGAHGGPPKVSVTRRQSCGDYVHRGNQTR